MLNEITVSNSFPPNYKQIKAKFNPPDNVVFTYGDTCYAPYIHFKLPEDLLVHEFTHTRQQQSDPAGWWDKYIDDDKFRLDQEVAAYRNQYRFFKLHHDRESVFFFASRIARDLASPTYNNIIDYDTALKLIRQ